MTIIVLYCNVDVDTHGNKEIEWMKKHAGHEMKKEFKKCQVNIKNTEISYTCLDCAKNPTSIMCSKCFLNSKHLDTHNEDFRIHRYTII